MPDTAQLLTICIGMALFGFIKNKVAATVNGEKIYLKDIKKVYKKYNVCSDETQRNNFSLTRQKILNNAINEILVLQEAKRKGITVSNSEVNDRIQELKHISQKFIIRESGESFVVQISA